MSRTSTSTRMSGKASLSVNSNLGLMDVAIAKACHAERKLLDPQASHANSRTDGAKQSEAIDANAVASSDKPVQEIWKWTMTATAVASCFVRDALEMKECQEKGVEFFWLGRVPCRVVRIVGLIVGVQTYEKKTVYTVDDGTAVIDCNYLHPLQPVKEASPKKTGMKLSRKPESKDASSRKTSAHQHEHPAAPYQALSVGTSVWVVGRVIKWHDTRVIKVESIAQCASSNDEPNHWLAVCELHRTSYFSPSAGPFIIPQPIQHTRPRYMITNASQSRSETGDSPDPPTTTLPDPQTPSRSSVASSTHSSPISEASTANGAQSPIRLRHPSRLHTRDLTANTFRIYLKHYMDNAPQEDDRWSSTDDDSDDPGVGWSFTKTPTNRSRSSRHDHEAEKDATPRPGGHSSLLFATPRASASTSYREKPEVSTGAIRGYTLSHLRRVPELRLMAHRVVVAEAKRRAREERARIKESQSQSRPRSKPKPSSAVSSSGSRGPGQRRVGESIAPKIKRLFRFAIRQLFEEGGIVLWDGPVHSLLSGRGTVPSLLSFVSATSTQNRLWKGGSPKGDSTMFSSVSGTSQADGMGDAGDLSDPPPDEESYIPLTTPYLSRVVEQTITEIMSQPVVSASDGSPKLWNIPVLRSASRAGPTPAEILKHLQRRDERWERVGEWAIKDALEWSKARGRVWCVGYGRWELCG